MTDRMVLKVLDDKVFPEGTKYHIQWTNLRKDWIDEKDVNPYTIQVYNELKRYNIDICYSMENPKSAFVYCRTSLSEAILNEQKKECVNYCKDNSLPIDYLGMEKISGRNMKNLEGELGAFIPHLNENNVIIVTSPEILGKDIMKVTDFMFKMKKRNIDIHFIRINVVWNKNTIPEDKFRVRDILNKFELESDKKSKSFIEKNIKLRKLGHKTGKPPYGMKAKKVNGIRRFVENPIEQKNIETIMNIYKSFEDKKGIFIKIAKLFEKHKDESLHNPNFIKSVVKRQNNLLNFVNKNFISLKL